MLRTAIKRGRNEKGISLQDVLRIFPCATVMKQRHCSHCSSNSGNVWQKVKMFPCGVVVGESLNVCGRTVNGN
jgi:hypothetical protein